MTYKTVEGEHLSIVPCKGESDRWHVYFAHEPDIEQEGWPVRFPECWTAEALETLAEGLHQWKAAPEPVDDSLVVLRILADIEGGAERMGEVMLGLKDEGQRNRCAGAIAGMTTALRMAERRVMEAAIEDMVSEVAPLWKAMREAQLAREEGHDPGSG